MRNAADTMHQDDSVLSTMSPNVSALINNTEIRMATVFWEVSDESTSKILGAIEQKYGKITEVSTLSGGQTNSVYRIDIGGNTYVLKVGSGLDREQKFYGDSVISEYFPKLYHAFSMEDQRGLLFEYKSGVNGKEVVDDIGNWESIGIQMGSALRALHDKKSHQVSQEDRNIAAESMIDYLSWGNTEEDLERLRTVFRSATSPLVQLHGDFSPHNCLFIELDDRKYQISAIFDPSGRIDAGFAEFDIFYALNNRWVRDKETFKRGFILGYGEVDFESEIYISLGKVFTNYLDILYKNIK